jgi:hypothetical protein
MLRYAIIIRMPRLSGLPQPLPDWMVSHYPLFQKLVIGLSHKELEARGDIAPYDLYSHRLDIDLSKVAQAGGDFVQSQLEPVMCDRKVYGDIVKEYLAHANGKQAIAYCSGLTTLCRLPAYSTPEA